MQVNGDQQELLDLEDYEIGFITNLLRFWKREPMYLV
jgi:hypothetical protein